MPNLYFDNASTTFPSSKAKGEMLRILETYPGNPSSSHAYGKDAKRFLEETREDVATLLGLDKSFKNYIYFTSSATEANNIVLQSLLNSPSFKGDVIITNSEHPSITSNVGILEKMGFRILRAKAKNGIVTREAVEELLTPNTVLVESIFVNNILGSKNDIADIAKCVKDYSLRIGRRIHFHTDAVQSIGKTEFNLSSLMECGVTSASFSSHKFYAPRGAGILFLSSDKVQALSQGGGQERGLRGGTENIAAIGALKVALEDVQNNIKNDIKKISILRKTLLDNLSSSKVRFKVLSPTLDGSFVPNILSIALLGLPGEVCVRALQEKGISVGTTSACASNAKKSDKNALALMGFSKSESASAIRISFSHSQTQDDVNALSDALESVYSCYA